LVFSNKGEKKKPLPVLPQKTMDIKRQVSTEVNCFREKDLFLRNILSFLHSYSIYTLLIIVLNFNLND